VQQGSGAQAHRHSLMRQFTPCQPVQFGIKGAKQRVRRKFAAAFGRDEKRCDGWLGLQGVLAGRWADVLAGELSGTQIYPSRSKAEYCKASRYMSWPVLTTRSQIVGAIWPARSR
jgi:hypothetical protein